MKFPKPIMRTSELVKMGFPEEFLRRAYGDKNQRFATKLDPMKSNSPITYDTEGLWIWWQKQVELQTKTMQRR